MHKISAAMQVGFFLFFLACYLVFIIPAAVIVAFRRPVITPAPERVKTTIGLGHNVRRIY